MNFRTFRRLSGFFAMASAVLAIFLVWRGSNRPVILNQSIATLALVFGCAVIAVSGSFAFFLSNDFELRFMYLMLKWRRMAPPTKSNRWSYAIAIVVAVLLHGGLSYSASVTESKEYVDDEADYLKVAKEIENLPDGVRGLLPSLFRGEFREDNRNPLYPAAMAQFGAIWGVQIRGVHRPVLLSTWFGMAVVATTGVVSWRMFGPATGAFSAFLIAINGAMTQASSIIACETLLVLLTTLGWYAYAASRSPMSWRPAVIIGAVFGLAYLTKASALFPLLIVLASIVWRRENRLSWSGPGLMLISFVVISSPLLTRNVIRYQNPLHSFNNKLLFAESYDAGIAEPDLGTLGTLKRYLARHSVREVVVDRLLGGVLWEGFVLLRSLGPVGFDSGRAVFGAALLVLAAVGMGTKLGDKLAPGFLGLWTVVFLLFFGWYQPIASGDRFLLPLVPPLTICASLGLVCVWAAVSERSQNPV